MKGAMLPPSIWNLVVHEEEVTTLVGPVFPTVL